MGGDMRPPEGEPPPRPVDNVRVCARFRPGNSVEKAEKANRCVNFAGDGRAVTVDNGKDEPASFAFDAVFDDKSTQAQVYEMCAAPLVDDVLEGYSCTIFAYGQTGSGKTHTMMGPDDLQNAGEAKGIIPRISEEIFVAMEKADSDSEFIVKASFVEIYMERVRDLLNPSVKGKNLRIRESKSSGVELEGVEEIYVSTSEELLKVAAKGSASRAIASTRMNQDSSRSHSVFILTVTQRKAGEDSSKTGKLYLVDLAGSEMVKKTQATLEVLEEAKMINKSLSALGNVIKALVEGNKHVPYRDSKLTRILQDSLGGSAKTSLIITCSCFSYNVVETLSTLRFGSRAKHIKNKPKVNKTYSVAEYKVLLSKAKETIRELGVYCKTLEGRLGIGEADSGICDSKAASVSVKGVSSKPPTTTDWNSTASPSSKSSGPAPSNEEQNTSLLKRAEEALTIALDTADRLRSRLEDKMVELNLSREALAGLKVKVAQLEEGNSELGKEKMNMLQRNKDLELLVEIATLKQEELQLSIDGLRKEKSILVEELEKGTKSPIDIPSPIKRRVEASLNKQGKEVGDSCESEEMYSSSTRSPASAVSPGQLQVNTTAAISRTELLQRDLQTITDKYIELRLAHVEAQELLATSDSGKSLVMMNRLAEERAAKQHVESKLRSTCAMLEVLRQSESNWNLKLQNRENQIIFLEEALHGFQDTFRHNVEEYTEKLTSLEQELTMYKRAMDGLELVDVDGEETDIGCKGPKIAPRVIKPIRGRSVHLAKNKADEQAEPPKQQRRNSTTGIPPHSLKVVLEDAEKNEEKYEKNAAKQEQTRRLSTSSWLLGKLTMLAPGSSNGVKKASPSKSTNEPPITDESPFRETKAIDLVHGEINLPEG